MKERPILFSAPMVRSLLNCTKSQTRRVIKFPPFIVEPGEPDLTSAGWIDEHEGGPGWYGWMTEYPEEGSTPINCPYGKPGDRLWVRECYRDRAIGEGGHVERGQYVYRATENVDRLAERWRPSIHMPRWASRITLEITSVRVERLQDISEADAKAEGIETVRVSESDFRYLDYLRAGQIDIGDKEATCGSAVKSYRTLWESINGPGSWEANPWVWVISFRMV